MENILLILLIFFFIILYAVEKYDKYKMMRAHADIVIELLNKITLNEVQNDAK